jgi:tetratricopeptide (TPR) repeat protein
MKQHRPSFFSLPALLLMGLLLALVLYVLFPRQGAFDDLRSLNDPDAVSLAYLEAQLKSDPHNTLSRINLARMQSRAGQYNKARNTLAPLMAAPTVPSRAMETYLELLVSQIYGAPNEDQRQARMEDLNQALQRLLETNDSLDRKLALASPALPLLASQDQLVIRQSLFEQADGLPRLTLANQLARQYEALEQPDNAADILESVLGLVPAVRRDDFIDNLIRLKLASGRPGEALALFRQRLTDAPRTSDQLREGIRLARLAGADELRKNWLGALARAEPADLDVQRQWLSLQLADGNTSGALATLRRIQDNTQQLPQQDWQQAAQILEWNGRPAEALGYWRKLYQADNSKFAFERATQLSGQLFQWQALADLFNTARSRNALPADGFRELADTLVRLGRLDEAETRLREGLDRFPQSSALRERLATLLLNRRRFSEGIALLESGPELSDAEHVQLARLYWQIRDPESAFGLLSVEPANPTLGTEATAMRLELARILGRTDFLEAEYERLAALPPEQVQPGVREQILNLSVMFGDLPTALRLARQRLEETGDPRYLAATAEYQLGLNDWSGLSQALDQWQAKAPGADRNPRYWTLRALLLQHRNQDEDAMAAFENAARLAPDNTDVLISWSWFLVGHPDRLPGRLPQLLEQLAVSPSRDSFRVLAFGYRALGAQARALYWLGRGRAAHPQDADWLLSMAPLAEQAGAMAEGQALRRQAIASNGAAAGQSKDSVLFPEPARTGEVTGPLYRFNNRALQVGLSSRDLGGFSIHGRSLRGQFSHDRFRWLFSASTLSASGQGLLRSTPDTGNNVRLQFQNNSSNALLTFSLGQLSRSGGSETTAGAEITGQPGDRLTLTAGAELNERAFDSAEAWWLANRDSFYASASYQPFSRLNLFSRLQHLSFAANTGSSLGSGYGLDAIGTYTLFRQDPGWQVSVGYRRQSLSLAGALDTRTAQALQGSASPGNLIAEDYERIGLGSRWFHGEPHALYRTAPEPRFFVGLAAGYVLSTSSPDFGVDLGMDWRVVGDDDLALSLGYTSDGLDGSARTDLNLTYTLYFGR